MTDLRITVRNTSENGGTFLTPTYFGFHDGSFDLFEVGEAASAGLEILAEDGGAAGLTPERLAAAPDSQGLVVFGAGGPIAAQEFTSATIDVDGLTNGFVSLAAMILPSNDAFIGTDDALQLFDANGRFLGETTVSFEGSDVYDAGTEVNTELDAAFINQTGPNTGVDENGVIRLHEGFNGSEGNPVGEGDQIILGGVNAAGADIDPIAADFTRDGAQNADIHINTVIDASLSRGRDTFNGLADDDIVRGLRGADEINGGGGWDVISGNRGRDTIDGGNGADIISGNIGADLLFGGNGDDIISGNRGNDTLSGGRGDDAFVFNNDRGRDVITDFDTHGDDVIELSVAGFNSFDDVLAAASQESDGVTIDLSNTSSILLEDADLADLSASDFVFA